MQQPEGKKLHELVIFDLDSTLSDVRHRHALSPFVDPASNWPTYAKAGLHDTPLTDAIVLLNLLWERYGIYILTGRDAAAWDETKAWLALHGVKYDFLKMREATDVDDNGVYKAAYIEKLKADGFEVKILLDDWPGVINTVRAGGTPALCVNPLYVDSEMASYDAQHKQAVDDAR